VEKITKVTRHIYSGVTAVRISLPHLSGR